MLELLAVSKSYHAIPAVRQVTLCAAPGKVVGVLGPNGSGKSTTVRMIVGLLRPTSGEIRWHGCNIHQALLQYQGVVGYVPEEPRLYTYLTPTEYLRLVGGLRGIRAKPLTHRIDRYLELFGLDTNRHAVLASLSKGMRQKVLLAAALIHDPAILVLDEPNSGLDFTSTLVLRALIRALVTRGKIIIYSSHLLDDVEKVCEEVLILKDSHVVAHASVARVRELTRSASLEEAFATLTRTQDATEVGCELADVALL